MDKSKSYLAAPKHGECYEGLIKYYDLDKSLFSTYGPKAKESKSGSSKGTKSQPKSSGKSVQSEEPEFEVEVMRKHGYGYLKEIVVRRADNDLYKFKEGDFPRLRINDIEDMLLLVVQNRLINLSGNDVSDFAIALRMFTRSLVIHKRVKDLQLRVESYQKKINSPGHKLPYPASGKETRTLHTKTLKDSFMSKTMGETG
ncbi:hypothetical protein Tco_1048611 [Tanacetum coccineum]